MGTNQQKLKWYEQSGQQGDIVISTRVRLARNLAHTPFPSTLSNEDKRQLSSKIHKVLSKMPSGGELEEGSFDYLDMESMLERDALSMVERHLISPEFARRNAGSALFLKRDESVSIMINEEDHLRIQVMCPGLDLDDAYQIADDIDTRLDEKLHFAFDDRLGYLTQCPSNIGTGMRASLMLHLPALQEQGAIAQLANTVSKLGLTIRGLYGEGTKPEGSMYQLSNQITLGISEQAALDNLKSIASQIIRQERAARQQMKQNPKLEDSIWRSFGILKNARLLTHDEFMTLFSNVRLGVALGYLEDINQEALNKLLTDVQPATLMASLGEDMDALQRDKTRAEIVRKSFA